MLLNPPRGGKADIFEGPTLKQILFPFFYCRVCLTITTGNKISLEFTILQLGLAFYKILIKA